MVLESGGLMHYLNNTKAPVPFFSDDQPLVNMLHGEGRDVLRKVEELMTALTLEADNIDTELAVHCSSAMEAFDRAMMRAERDNKRMLIGRLKLLLV
jgi:hypothetical protein